MLHYRPFRNTDPRHLVDIWRSHSACRALVQPMSVGLLDDYVFAKLYFDREGLIVAELDGQPVGFVHAGFGPNERGDALDRGVGIIAMLMTHPLAAFEKTGENVEHELLSRAEAYLDERGARRILLGGSGRNAPFYLGLYGGSALPGIVTSDESLSAFACDTANPASPLAAGYKATGHRTIWHRELATLRPAVDRTQMQIRRRANVEITADPPAASWWEACVYGPMDRVRFDLVGRDGSAGPVGARWAWAEFWAMEAFSAKWGIRAMGLKRIEVDSAQRREGLATFLLGEALKQLHSQGVAVVEAQARDDDPSSAALFRKLGFVEVDRATLYEKAVSAASPAEANRDAPTRCPVKA